MKIIKKILNINGDGLFDKKGNVILTEDTAYLMDCISTIFLAGIQVNTLAKLHLELYRCSIYISHPDLAKVIDYLVKRGLLSKTSFSQN